MKFIMNFLRSPFQFRSTDQPSRKTESDSSVVENMFIDPSTGLTTDSKWRASSPGIGSSSSISGSPRLQHRVPGFENNGNSPGEAINEPSAQQSASTEDCEKSQRVRVVPIKVESVDDAGTPKKRSNVFHSSSGSIPRSNHFGPLYPNFEEFHNRKRHSSGPTLHKKPDTTESKAKVCNIPIFIEGRDTPVVPKTTSPQCSPKAPGHNIPSQNTQSETLKQNGGNLTKCSTKSKNKDDAKQRACDVSLKQISSILSELQSLKTSVNEFSGVPQDKQYRYLDEMLTRCMLKLDDVETHGDDEVRSSRKAAIKAVQECINDLESRSQANTKVSETAGGSGDNTLEFTDTKMEEICDGPKEETVGENIQGSSETIDKTEDPSVVNEQSATKETDVMQQEEYSCLLQKTSPVSSISKESSSEATKSGLVEPADTAVAKDHKNCKQSEDNVNEPVDMEQGVSAATNEPVNVLEELKTSEESAGTVDEPMDSVEVTGLSSQSNIPGGLFQQNEPMDSEVPEPVVKSDSEMAAIKDGSVECEMELTKENTSLEENKDSSVPN